jgi:DNA-binding transcriptional ArsR family regulator
MKAPDMYAAAEQATGLLKALASRNRLLLLCRLSEGEKSVGELAALLAMREAAVSQQLALLRKDRLVAPRRDGQTIYYRLSSPEAARLIETLYAIFCAEACPP